MNALFSHFVYGRIIDVHFSLFYQPRSHIQYLLERIGSISDHIGLKAKYLTITQYVVYKLVLLLGGIGVIKSNDELSIVVTSKVLVE